MMLDPDHDERLSLTRFLITSDDSVGDALYTIDNKLLPVGIDRRARLLAMMTTIGNWGDISVVGRLLECPRVLLPLAAY